MSSKGNLFKRTLNTRYFGRKTSFYEEAPQGKGKIRQAENKETSNQRAK